MNATETIAAAIRHLEDLRDGATPGRWSYYNEPWGDVMSEQEPGLGVETSVAIEMSDLDGTLVVVLHSLIPEIIAILRSAEADAIGSHDEPGAFLQAERLAKRILGVS